MAGAGGGGVGRGVQQGAVGKQGFSNIRTKTVGRLPRGAATDLLPLSHTPWHLPCPRVLVPDTVQGDEGQFEEWERLYGHGAVEGAAVGPGEARAPGEYVFAENNPFLGDPEALQKGKDLFRWEPRMAGTTSCWARGDGYWHRLGSG